MGDTPQSVFEALRSATGYVPFAHFATSTDEFFEWTFADVLHI